MNTQPGGPCAEGDSTPCLEGEECITGDGWHVCAYPCAGVVGGCELDGYACMSVGGFDQWCIAECGGITPQECPPAMYCEESLDFLGGGCVWPG